jgi:exopolysaccharide production protein ExoQ
LPPILALGLFSGFVIFLLWLERKQSPGVTRYLWIPTIWMLLIASRPIGNWFPQAGADPALGSPLDRAFLLALLFLTIFVLVKRNFRWAEAIKDNIWVILLICYMAISIFWSNIPFISFKRWTREFEAVLMAFVLLSEPSPRRAMECILRRTIYILIPFSVLLCKYFPDYGVTYNRWGWGMWIGVTTHKNPLGRLCLIAAFFLIWTLVRRRQGKNPPVWRYQSYVEGIVLLMAFYLMRGPQRGGYSATAVASLAIGLLFYVVCLSLRKYHKTLRAGTVQIIVVAIITVGVITVFTQGSIVGRFAPTVGRNATLTDRTQFWTSLLPVVRQSPVLGKGYGGFWMRRADDEQLTEGHNGYLDVLLQLGFVGLLLFTAFLLSSVRKAQKVLSYDFDWGILWICFIIMAILHNITESSISSLANHLTAIVLFFSAFSVSSFSSEPGAP